MWFDGKICFMFCDTFDNHFLFSILARRVNLKAFSFEELRRKHTGVTLIDVEENRKFSKRSKSKRK